MMIAKKLLDSVLSDFVFPSEQLVGHYFKRELNRRTQVYNFFLYIVVEDEKFGLCTTRSILLGSSPRDK